LLIANVSSNSTTSKTKFVNTNSSLTKTRKYTYLLWKRILCKRIFCRKIGQLSHKSDVSFAANAEAFAHSLSWQYKTIEVIDE
jgi:hypothetical protein